MINEYVMKLIENLPDDIKNAKEPLVIDLVLDGGIFNGSYLVGALYFLKEMENRKYIKIDRISGCSIGSIVAFLYFIDGLDLMPELYNIINKDFRETYKLEKLKELKKYLEQNIPTDICQKVNGKLFITYNNVIKFKKVVKKEYKDVDDIINSLINSCFVPILIDGNILNKGKYVDGFNPYIFNLEINKTLNKPLNKILNKKILHLDLYGYDKVGYLLNVKNEKTNYHRILSGLLDIHSFFIKGCSTPMCSYVNNWTISDICFNRFKTLVERIVIYIVYFLVIMKKYLSNQFKDNILYKLFSKISHVIFVIMLENYCL
jgi:hypothetical protein